MMVTERPGSAITSKRISQVSRDQQNLVDGNLDPTVLLSVFREVGHLVRHTPDLRLMLGRAAQVIGSALMVERVIILVASDGQQSDYTLEIVGEFSGQALKPIGTLSYRVGRGSE